MPWVAILLDMLLTGWACWYIGSQALEWWTHRDEIREFRKMVRDL
jgi:hypothetical protein